MSKLTSGEWRVASRIFLLCVLCALCGESVFACGTERWAVKTLADPQAQSMLRAAAEPTTVSSLMSKSAPDRKTLDGAANSRFSDELHKYQVYALVRGYKLEADGDFHIVLADPTNPRRTLVAEIPDPACVPEHYRDLFTGVRAKFVRAFGKPTAKFHRRTSHDISIFVGVGFFDFIHGQTGVAPNGFELHPLLDFNVLIAQPVIWDTAEWQKVRNQ